MTLPKVLKRSSRTIVSRPSEYFLAFLAVPYIQTAAMTASASEKASDLENAIPIALVRSSVFQLKDFRRARLSRFPVIKHPM